MAEAKGYPPSIGWATRRHPSIIVIDEFHVLRQQLPDAIERFIRIASLGRSLGMHLIACTQHPLGQVHAEMKSNMALNLCLRVRDGMQSSELIGSSAAAGIPPTMPGAFCSNGGVAVYPKSDKLAPARRAVHHRWPSAWRAVSTAPGPPIRCSPHPCPHALPAATARALPAIACHSPWGTTARASTTSSCNRRRAASPSSGAGAGNKTTALRMLAASWVRAAMADGW
ncbi:MAG: hypothetical protein ACLUUF_00840 [Bifidobacterium pullorum]